MAVEARGAVLQWPGYCGAVDQGGQERGQVDQALLPDVQGQPGSIVVVRLGLERFHVGCSGIRWLASPDSAKTSAKTAIAFGASHATQHLKPL